MGDFNWFGDGGGGDFTGGGGTSGDTGGGGFDWWSSLFGTGGGTDPTTGGGGFDWGSLFPGGISNDPTLSGLLGDIGAFIPQFTGDPSTLPQSTFDALTALGLSPQDIFTLTGAYSGGTGTPVDVTGTGGGPPDISGIFSNLGGNPWTQLFTALFGSGSPQTIPSTGGPSTITGGVSLSDLLKKIFGALGKGNIGAGGAPGGGTGAGGGGAKPGATNPLASLLQKLLAGGLLGAGAFGNISNAKTQADFVQQMIDWRKTLQGLALNPDQVNALTSGLIGPMMQGLTPENINSITNTLQKNLSQGLTSGVTNQVQSQLASRGMMQTPGAFGDILAQSLAPYQQNLLQMSGNEAMGLLGMQQGAKQSGISELMTLLGLPTQGGIPPFLPQQDLSGLMSMLFGGGGGAGGGGGSDPLSGLLQLLGLGGSSGGAGGGTDLTNLTGLISSLGLTPDQFTKLILGGGAGGTGGTGGGGNINWNTIFNSLGFDANGNPIFTDPGMYGDAGSPTNPVPPSTGGTTPPYVGATGFSYGGGYAGGGGARPTLPNFLEDPTSWNFTPMG